MIKKISFSIFTAFVVYHFIANDKFNLEMVRGLRVVVTGASTGIGEQVAYQYARMGSHLVITARREHLLKQVIKRCRTLAPPDTKLLYFVADMEISYHTQKLVQFAKDKLGGIDQLMMNHGYYDEFHPWLGNKNNITKLDKYMSVNFFSLVKLWSYAMPVMTQNTKGGTVGVVSSLGGKVPGTYLATYSASKFALDGFFGAIRQELKEAKHNITVTLHILGFIATKSAITLMDQLKESFHLDGDKFEAAFTPVDVSDCAYEMIRATTLGERELHYPASQLIGLQVKIRHFLPFEMFTMDSFR